jgi:acyl transferase domain-containing protein
MKEALQELRTMRAQLKQYEMAQREQIAIIGMACRFPGGATSPEKFWQCLVQGQDAITEIPQDRWSVEDYYDPDPDAPGKMYTRLGGFIEGIDRFDAPFFNLSPKEAASLDPQQRLLLEATWEALERSGQAPSQLLETPTGIFMGICSNDYGARLLGHDPQQINAYMATGNAHSMAAGRLSHFLGLTGPSLAIDTACSSSLVTVHLACQSLRNRECDLAITGGVNCILSPAPHINFSKARMLSPDCRCKTFDAAANGYVRGEGCGVVLLKRLAAAQADGDPILAIVRGSAINQDGPSSGLTVPNAASQQAVIRQALANSGVSPAEIDYVEAHGTGTALGDPIEMRSLAAVFGPHHSAQNPLIVGSVKTNIGHLEGAAGVASLIKTVLALQQATLPPISISNTLPPTLTGTKFPSKFPPLQSPGPKPQVQTKPETQVQTKPETQVQTKL